MAAWRVALEASGLGSVSINVRITAVRKLAVEAADNGLLANGITRVKGVASKGVRLGNWLSLKQAQSLLNAPDITTAKGLRDRAIIAVLLGCGLRRSEVAALTFKHIQQRDGRWCIVENQPASAALSSGRSAPTCFRSHRKVSGGRVLVVTRSGLEPVPDIEPRPQGGGHGDVAEFEGVTRARRRPCITFTSQERQNRQAVQNEASCVSSLIIQDYRSILSDSE